MYLKLCAPWQHHSFLRFCIGFCSAGPLAGGEFFGFENLILNTLPLLLCWF